MPSTKSQSPGPSLAPTPPPATTSLPARAKKAPKQPAKEKDMAGRSASGGGVKLDTVAPPNKKKDVKAATNTPTPASQKPPPQASTSKPKHPSPKESTPDTPTTPAKPPTAAKDGKEAPTRQRKRPRKLNKDPQPAGQKPPDAAGPAGTAATPATTQAPSKKATDAGALADPATELEALKSRVRGLEAKVEQLYKSSSAAGGRRASDARSPRRRGKRKGSSATQVPTVSSSSPGVLDDGGRVVELDGDDDDGRNTQDAFGRGGERGVDDFDDVDVDDEEEELVRLEGELAVARRDLAAYRPRSGARPRSRRTASGGDTDDVEEIARGEEPGVAGRGDGGGAAAGRQVTLSGSYRIPLPASVSVEDVRHIQSGVSAAQNVARSFLEQRRAANAAAQQQQQQQQQQHVSGSETKAKTKAKTAKGAKKTASSAVTKVAEREDEGGKKSWGEWFGGYSMAISRAVKSIEAEAAIESQRVGEPGVRKGTQSAGRGGKGKGKTSARPSAKQPLYE